MLTGFLVSKDSNFLRTWNGKSLEYIECKSFSFGSLGISEDVWHG
jgi:hypothetical protein